jgi:hypothetical protein
LLLQGASLAIVPELPLEKTHLVNPGEKDPNLEPAERTFEYYKVANLLSQLHRWNSGNSWDLKSPQDALVRLYEDLALLGILKHEDALAAVAWIHDLESLGYQFPSLASIWSPLLPIPKLAALPNLPCCTDDIKITQTLQVEQERWKTLQSSLRTQPNKPHHVLLASKILPAPADFVDNVVCLTLPWPDIDLDSKMALLYAKNISVGGGKEKNSPWPVHEGLGRLWSFFDFFWKA